MNKCVDEEGHPSPPPLTPMALGDGQEVSLCYDELQGYTDPLPQTLAYPS